MTSRVLLVVALASLAVPALARADIDRLPVPAPLPATEFVGLDLATLPSSNFSAGWDAVKAVAISQNQLLRFFYRKADGLFVGVMEDLQGHVLAQSKVWLIGANLDTLDLTLATTAVDATPFQWSTSLVVFSYNRSSGIGSRRVLTWDVRTR